MRRQRTLARDPPGATRAPQATSALVAHFEPAPTSVGESESGLTLAGGGLEIAAGIARLDDVTLYDAMRAVEVAVERGNAGDTDRQGARLVVPPNARASLRSLVSEVWYIAHEIYRVDRAGHLAPHDFHFGLRLATLSPGVYFLGRFGIRSYHAERFTETWTPVLLRLTEHGPEVVSGDVSPRSILEGYVGSPITGQRSLVELGRAVLDAHHGIAVVVSQQAASRHRRGGRSLAHVEQVLSGLGPYIRWEVAVGLDDLLVAPTEATRNFVLQEALGRAAALLGAGGPLLVTLLIHEGAEFVDNLNIGARASATADEIDLASQAVARQIVSAAAMAAVSAGMAAAAAGLRGLRSRFRGPTPRPPELPATTRRAGTSGDPVQWRQPTRGGEHIGDPPLNPHQPPPTGPTTAAPHARQGPRPLPPSHSEPIVPRPPSAAVSALRTRQRSTLLQAAYDAVEQPMRRAGRDPFGRVTDPAARSRLGSDAHFKELAFDQGRGGWDDQTVLEAEAILEAERRGLVDGPCVRNLESPIDFQDARGVDLDHVAPPMMDPASDAESLVRKLTLRDYNVLLDDRALSPAQARALIADVRARLLLSGHPADTLLHSVISFQYGGRVVSATVPRRPP